jgi:hypothetical protein
MVVHSANPERANKINKLIHSKARNQLSSKKVNKLVYCYQNLRTIDKADKMEHPRSDSSVVLSSFAAAAASNFVTQDSEESDDDNTIYTNSQLEQEKTDLEIGILASLREADAIAAPPAVQRIVSSDERLPIRPGGQSRLYEHDEQVARALTDMQMAQAGSAAAAAAADIASCAMDQDEGEESSKSSKSSKSSTD